MIRKTAHNYPKIFDGLFGQISDNLIIEATWFGSYEPYQIGEVSSLIYQMMIKANQQKIAEEYGLIPFVVNVLSPERTFCEKIMCLVRCSYTDDPVKDLKNKIRHIYDLNQMLESKELELFFCAVEFEELLVKVANDDMLSFKSGNEWLQKHPTEARIFEDRKNIWEKLEPTYFSTFSKLVYGKLPAGYEMLETLNVLTEGMKNMEWKIRI